MKQINFYIDMDGVQARYGFDNTVEEMEEQGYFTERPAQENALELVRLLDHDPRFTVTILSAVFDDQHSRRDKLTWLREHGMEDVDVCFTPCGYPKAGFVSTGGVNILIDDYTQNLREWETAGAYFCGIKFLNGGNGRKGTWAAGGGCSISFMEPAEVLYQKVCAMAEEFAAA